LHEQHADLEPLLLAVRQRPGVQIAAVDQALAKAEGYVRDYLERSDLLRGRLAGWLEAESNRRF